LLRRFGDDPISCPGSHRNPTCLFVRATGDTIANSKESTMQPTSSTSLAKNTAATIIPGMHYRDAAAAIEWLCNTFGFEKRSAYPGDDGKIMHAELTFGNGMIMLGTKRSDGVGQYLKQPDEIGGCTTQSIYVIVTDADAIYERAKSAGAEILFEIETKNYGGRGFTCRDLEGHIWSFGTFDPWNWTS
jgi:uncharacterized glyoxalase superfamily protein PhnB